MDEVEESIEDTEERLKKVKESKQDKKKRVIRIRKSKKEKENPIHSAIRLTVESGKVAYGYRNAIRNCSLKTTKLFILAENAPLDITKSLARANKSGIPLLNYEGSSMELGSICGRPYTVSVLSVFDFGNSDIKKLVKKK